MATEAAGTWFWLSDARVLVSYTYLFAPCPQSGSKEGNTSQLNRGGVGGRERKTETELGWKPAPRTCFLEEGPQR